MIFCTSRASSWELRAQFPIEHPTSSRKYEEEWSNDVLASLKQREACATAVASQSRAQLTALTKSHSRKLSVLIIWSERKAFAQPRVTIELVVPYPLVRHKKSERACIGMYEDGREPGPARISLL